MLLKSDMPHFQIVFQGEFDSPLSPSHTPYGATDAQIRRKAPDGALLLYSGRGGEIRTRGLYVPNVARYHAAPLPVFWPKLADLYSRYINVSVPNEARYRAALLPDGLLNVRARYATGLERWRPHRDIRAGS